MCPNRFFILLGTSRSHSLFLHTDSGNQTFTHPCTDASQPSGASLVLIRGRGSPAGPPDATSHAEQVLRRALLANCSLQILVEVELLRVLNSVLASTDGVSGPTKFIPQHSIFFPHKNKDASPLFHMSSRQIIDIN